MLFPTTIPYQLNASKIQDMRTKIPPLNDKWNEILSNRSYIIDSIQNNQTTQNQLPINDDKMSFKMQKQKDIIDQIEYDNHLMIITGSLLALCLISVFGIYVQK